MIYGAGFRCYRCVVYALPDAVQDDVCSAGCVYNHAALRTRCLTPYRMTYAVRAACILTLCTCSSAPYRMTYAVRAACILTLRCVHARRRIGWRTQCGLRVYSRCVVYALPDALHLQEVALLQLHFTVHLAVPTHPLAELRLHRLSQRRTHRNQYTLNRPTLSVNNSIAVWDDVPHQKITAQI